jgi:hypothetical protein
MDEVMKPKDLIELDEYLAGLGLKPEVQEW